MPNNKALLICVFLLVFLGGCDMGLPNDTSSFTPQNITDGISDYDEESAFRPTASESEESDTTKSSENEDTDGEFVVKSKKYNYSGNDLVLLNIENQTSKSYSLTISGVYLDKDQNVLKEETQTFKDFASGYQNYFLFQPQISFETFRYEINAVEFEGNCLSAKISNVWLGELIPHKGVIQERMIQGDFTEYPCLLAKVGHSNNNECRVAIDRTVIFLTESGDVYKIMKTGTFYMNAGVMNDYTTYDLYYEMTDAERVEIPSELQGKFSILIAIHSVEEDKKG